VRSYVTTLMACLLLGCGFIGHADSIPTGRFVYRSEPQDMEFEISLPGGATGQTVAIPFAARTLSGRGAAPEGEIQGIPAEGVWSVSFSDSFGNTGKGTILLRPGLVLLELRLDKITDPRCSRFYGSMRLAREG
jgi:hypothetical protein